MSAFGKIRDLDILKLGMVIGGSAAVEFQEKLGQREMCQSEAIPVRRDGITDEQLTALGFVLGERAKGDDLFQQATLPACWKNVHTDHSMWSKIVDGKGRDRFLVFFKAAFYDRSAHMHSIFRYTINDDYDAMEKTNKMRVVVRDFDGTVLFAVDGTVEKVGYDAPRAIIDAYYAEADKLREQATKWLDAKYPNRADFTAYWD